MELKTKSEYEDLRARDGESVATDNDHAETDRGDDGRRWWMLRSDDDDDDEWGNKNWMETNMRDEGQEWSER